MNNYKELVVWKKSMDMVEKVYQLVKGLLDSEKFSLTSQITQSALSVPLNIAEGAGRKSNKDFSRFLSIANASSYELETQLILMERIFSIKVSEVLNILIEIQKMIYSLNKTLTIKET
ncbi:four helix bundle protein [Crocinitomix catalasitica]|uniref:four helix bundle protein n=1 Tax=Crocinitomix catalasitica TaxID=184607 RepID=UPI000484C150|nr:four helix bundle protein [Crocinitomix catalasitica]